MAGKPQRDSAHNNRKRLKDKLDRSPRKAVIKYLRGVMLDKGNSEMRRDMAAAMLSKVIIARSKIQQSDRALEGRKAIKKIVAERMKINTAKRTEAATGKKSIKKVAAQEIATNNEWDDLIPKAQVIQLRRAK